MTDIHRKFHLSREQLCDIRDYMEQGILHGLTAHHQEIKALPAYLRRPCAILNGETTALDVGGTNIRAAWIRISENIPVFLSGPVSDQEGIMRRSEKIGRITDHQFFAKQADLITEVCRKQRIKVGYCFSFPAEIRPGCSATLLRWTKDIHIDNVIGTSVGDRLRTELHERGRFVQNIPVINDAAASLLSGALIAPECTHTIGLIAGTGTNMASFFPVSRITKLFPDDCKGWNADDEMAVNLESGNLTPPHLTEFDDRLDSSNIHDHPASQRFEKAVSGAYLPRLFALVAGRDKCLQLGFDSDTPGVHAGMIASIRDQHSSVGKIAAAVIDRSADLLAAAAAGLIRTYEQGQKQVAILAEGSLFWQTPGYCERFQQTLIQLINKGTTVKLLQCPIGYDANLLGAACAALSTGSDA